MKWHDVEQNTPEWDALRLGKVTGSNNAKFMANAGKAFGDPAIRYALQIALERETGQKCGHSFKNDETDRGHEQEPIARALYEESYFTDVQPGGFFDHGDWGVSPDGLVGDDGVIEVKSVIAPVHRDTIRRGSFDPSYRWQIVGHLDGTQRQWVDFVSYCSDYPEHMQLVVYRVWRDEMAKELEMLRERRAAFLEVVLAEQSQLKSRTA